MPGMRHCDHLNGRNLTNCNGRLKRHMATKQGKKSIVIPKSSILIGFSIINHPFWGTFIFGNTQMMAECWVFFLGLFGEMMIARVEELRLKYIYMHQLITVCCCCLLLTSCCCCCCCCCWCCCCCCCCCSETWIICKKKHTSSQTDRRITNHQKPALGCSRGCQLADCNWALGCQHAGRFYRECF